MAYTTEYPKSPSTGAIYGDPTVFNASGTYTIPPTATPNSTIIVECIGGGSGGSGPSNIYAITNLQDYIGFPSVQGGQGGAMVIGTYRLGFLSSAPAGQSLTVTVGSGGTGAIQNATFNKATSIGGEGSQTAITNFVAATNGGASTVAFGASTFITASGGTSTSTTNQQTSNSFMTAVESNILNSTGPRAGSSNAVSGNNSGNTMTVTGQSSGGSGRTEFGGASTNNPNASTSYVWSTGTVTVPDGVDAPAGSGCGGSGSGFRGFSGSTTTTTQGRGGNGASPGGGGGGGGYGSFPAAQSSSGHTINAGQRGGNGGTGRVRIYYQA
jgi:hypothetical protein